MSKEEEVARLIKAWNKEKSDINAMEKTRSDLEQARVALENAHRESNYGKASEFRCSTIPGLQAQVTQGAKERGEKEKKGGTSLVYDSVSANDIEAVVSRQTGIPVTNLMSGEIEKLINM